MEAGDMLGRRGWIGEKEEEGGTGSFLRTGM